MVSGSFTLFRKPAKGLQYVVYFSWTDYGSTSTPIVRWSLRFSGLHATRMGTTCILLSDVFTRIYFVYPNPLYGLHDTPTYKWNGLKSAVVLSCGLNADLFPGLGFTNKPAQKQVSSTASTCWERCSTIQLRTSKRRRLTINRNSVRLAEWFAYNVFFCSLS